MVKFTGSKTFIPCLLATRVLVECMSQNIVIHFKILRTLFLTGNNDSVAPMCGMSCGRSVRSRHGVALNLPGCCRLYTMVCILLYTGTHLKQLVLNVYIKFSCPHSKLYIYIYIYICVCKQGIIHMHIQALLLTRYGCYVVKQYTQNGVLSDWNVVLVI